MIVALDRLDQAKPFAKSLYQTDIFQLAIELASSADGLSVLYEYANRFDEAGVFLGGLWEDPTKMEPQLVGGSLRMKDINSIVELLSEMRMLAIAKGDYIHEDMSIEKAGAFLNEVLALNLDLLYPVESVEDRMELEDHMIRAQHLFHLPRSTAFF